MNDDNMYDEIRRQARDTQAMHNEAMPQLRDAMTQLFEQEGRTADEKSVAVGAMSPGALFKVGGITLAGAALLAACGSDSKDNASPSTNGATTTTVATSGTGGTSAMSSDVIILRTASSIEELAIAAYQIAIDSGLVKTAAIGDAAKLFQSQHREHSALFQSETKRAGGTPFDKPNPAVLAALKPTIDALKDEMGIVKLAFDLETAAAQTYQSNVGVVIDPKLNAALMSVGGVEARHAAILAGVLGNAAVAKAFQGADQAVKAGTGV